MGGIIAEVLPALGHSGSFVPRHNAEAVEQAFGSDIDYAMLVKIYGASSENPESRYSPATCIGCRTGVLVGDPDPRYISTSFVERSNLSRRMGMRRFTRLTNAFGKCHRRSASAHIHHVHFLPYAINGVPSEMPEWLDAVNVPCVGTMEFVMDFTDPRIRRTSVFHWLLSHRTRA